MKNVAIGLALVTLFSGTAWGAAKKRLRAQQEDAMSCVKFTQAEQKERRTIVYNLDNKCGSEVKCSVSWRVWCASRGQPGASQTVEMAAGEAQEVEADAAQCDAYAKWNISAPRWSCHKKEGGDVERALAAEEKGKTGVDVALHKGPNRATK